MATLSRDTSPEAERVMLDALRKKTPSERLMLALKASEALRQMGLASVRRDYPDAGEQEVLKRFAVRWLGRELTKKVYGWDPEKDG